METQGSTVSAYLERISSSTNNKDPDGNDDEIDLTKFTIEVTIPDLPQPPSAPPPPPPSS